MVFPFRCADRLTFTIASDAPSKTMKKPIPSSALLCSEEGIAYATCDRRTSRDRDGYGANSSSPIAVGESSGGIHDSPCAFRLGIHGRNGLRGHSTHDSHDDCDRSSEC